MSRVEIEGAVRQITSEGLSGVPKYFVEFYCSPNVPTVRVEFRAEDLGRLRRYLNGPTVRVAWVDGLLLYVSEVGKLEHYAEISRAVAEDMDRLVIETPDEIVERAKRATAGLEGAGRFTDEQLGRLEELARGPGGETTPGTEASLEAVRVIEGRNRRADAERAPLELTCKNCEYRESCVRAYRDDPEKVATCPRFRELYSAARTERFAADVVTLGSPRSVEVVLALLTDSISHPFGDCLTAWVEIEGVFTRWTRLSSWGRVNALFLLAPVLEEIVTAKARELASIARGEEVAS